jgi:hypothetical protein
MKSQILLVDDGPDMKALILQKFRNQSAKTGDLPIEQVTEIKFVQLRDLQSARPRHPANLAR